MANDARLEQLKSAQEQAFARKQSAYKEQQETWARLCSLKNGLDKAFMAKQSAYESKSRAWQDSHSVSDNNGPRIEYLNSAQERAFQNMKNAFDRASDAHDSRNGASAKAYSIEGHGYKTEAKGYVEERRRLVEECKIAKATYELYKQRFEDAKNTFGRIKDEHDRAKEIHENATTEFKRAKSDFDSAAAAFQERLSELRIENTKRKERNRDIAIKAGVPYRYVNAVYVSEDPDGTINIYFGGIDKPDGFGHGHYSMDGSGKITYRRNPSENHGSKNYTGANGMFNGQPAKVVFSDTGNSDRIDIYFGGLGEPDGPNHNHVTVIKENVRYWRENNLIIIDEKN